MCEKTAIIMKRRDCVNGMMLPTNFCQSIGLSLHAVSLPSAGWPAVQSPGDPGVWSLFSNVPNRFGGLVPETKSGRFLTNEVLYGVHSTVRYQGTVPRVPVLYHTRASYLALYPVRTGSYSIYQGTVCVAGSRHKEFWKQRHLPNSSVRVEQVDGMVYIYSREIIINICLLGAMFVLLTGWQPHSLETDEEEVATAELTRAPSIAIWPCYSKPYSTADSILLQRHQYSPEAAIIMNRRKWPEKWGARQQQFRCLEKSDQEAFDFIKDLTSASNMSGSSNGGQSSTNYQLVQAHWSGRERALGPILHSLVPLVWWSALAPNSKLSSTNNQGHGNVPRADQSHPQPSEAKERVRLLPPVLRVFAGSHRCSAAGHSLGCFLHPKGGLFRFDVNACANNENSHGPITGH